MREPGKKGLEVNRVLECHVDTEIMLVHMAIIIFIPDVRGRGKFLLIV